MAQPTSHTDAIHPTQSQTDIDHAKRRAKQLKRALANQDIDAINRFSAVFGERKSPAEANHADCLHVTAIESGAPSWPRLKMAIETASMNHQKRVSSIVRAVINGNVLLVRRLLELDHDLMDAHPGLMAAFGHEEQLRALLKQTPDAAHQTLEGYPVIALLCFSKWHQHDQVTDRFVETQIRILDLLLDHGASTNTMVPAEPGSDHGLSLLYGALGHAGNLTLAEALLKRGANPNDNESLYHATELPNLDGVRLLFAHGAEVGHTNAFYRLLDRETIEGVTLFLDHGTDPNAPLYMHPTAEPMDERNALHHAIIRGRSANICQLLIKAGADATKPFNGRSPFALANSCGNQDVARLLESLGFASELDPAAKLMAAVCALDKRAAKKILNDHPGLVANLSHEDLSRQTELAMRASSLPALALMVELGFDINTKGESDSPPIHSGAWWGHPEIVALYIKAGAKLDLTNMFGGDTLGTAIHGSANCPDRADGDYVAVVNALLDAGAIIKPDQGHLEMGSDEVTLLLESRLEAAKA